MHKGENKNFRNIKDMHGCLVLLLNIYSSLVRFCSLLNYVPYTKDEPKVTLSCGLDF